MAITTPTKKARIYTMKKARMKSEFVAEELRISKSTVNRQWQVLERHPDFYAPRKPGGGRKPIMDAASIQRAVDLVDSGSAANAADVNRQMDQPVADGTMRRLLREQNLYGHLRAKKPAMKESHFEARFEWSKQYLDWTVEDWSSAIFSDEKQIFRVKAHGSRYCRRRVYERNLPRNVQPRMRHGGGSFQVGHLTFFSLRL
jgi:hypothetical protein